MKLDMEVKGLKEMDKALRELGAEMGAKTLRSALREAAKPMEDYMLANAPESSEPRTIRTRGGERIEIRPGFLKSRIKRRTKLNKKGNSKKFSRNGIAIVQVGVFRVPYVVQLEYGTSKMAAQPFIRKAGNSTGESIQIFKRRLARRIELARKRIARKQRGN